MASASPSLRELRQEREREGSGEMMVSPDGLCLLSIWNSETISRCATWRKSSSRVACTDTYCSDILSEACSRDQGGLVLLIGNVGEAL
jgi:hypothetical protein